MTLSTIVTGARILNALSGQPDTTAIEQKYIQDTDTTKTIQVYEQKDTTKTQLDTLNTLYAQKLAADAKHTKKDSTANMAVVPKTGFAPVSISAEGSMTRSEKVNGSGVQQFNIQFANDASVKYVSQFDLATRAEKEDVLLVYAPVQSLFGGGKVGNSGLDLTAGYIKYGDGNSRDVHFLDLTAKKEFESVIGKLAASVNFGRGAGKKTVPEDYIIARITHKVFTAEGGFFSTRGLIGTKWMDFDKTGIYGWVAAHPDNLYLGIGNNTNTTYGFLGVTGLKDFGELTFLKYDRKTGDYWVKSQTGFGDVNKGFFSEENCDVVANYFSVDQFVPLHFSPLSTKGDLALKIESKGNVNTEDRNLEVMISNRNKILSVGLGVNTVYSRGETKSGVTLEAFKSINIGDFKGSLEARYDGANKKADFYFIANYGF